MLLKIKLNILLALLALEMSGQTTHYFSKVYNNRDGWESGLSVVEVDDHYIVGAITIVGDSLLSQNLLILGIDQLGLELWRWEYESPIYRYWLAKHGVIPDVQGGYIVGGSIVDTVFDFLLMKLNNNGDILWTKHYGGEADDYCMSLKQTPDSGFVMVGWTASFGDPNGDIYIVKTDLKGTTQWTKIYGGDGGDIPAAIDLTNDGGYIISGFSNSASSDWDVFAMKLDRNGNVEWDTTITRIGDDYKARVKQLRDGSYILSGARVTGFSRRPYICKLSSDGVVEWQKSYFLGGPDIATIQTRAIESEAGDLFFAGTWRNDNNLPIGMVMKINPKGDLIFAKAYEVGGEIDNYVWDASATKDNGLVVTGVGWESTDQNQDIWVFKIDGDGNCCYKVGCDSVSVLSSTGTNLPGANSRFNVYPSPADDFIRVVDNQNHGSFDLRIFNTLGVNVKNERSITTQNRIDVNKLPSGFYIYTISVNSLVLKKGNFIVE